MDTTPSQSNYSKCNDWPRWSSMRTWGSNPALQRSYPLLILIPLLATMISGWNSLSQSNQLRFTWPPLPSLISNEKCCSHDTGKSASGESPAQPESVSGCEQLISLPSITIPFRLKLLFVGLMCVSAFTFLYSISAPEEMRRLPGSAGTECMGRAEWCCAMLEHNPVHETAEANAKDRRLLHALLYSSDSPKALLRLRSTKDQPHRIVTRWNHFDTSRAGLRWCCFVLSTLGIGAFIWATLLTIIKVFINT